MNVIRSSRKWKIIVTGRRHYWLLSILEEILLPEEVATFKTQKSGSCFELSFYSIKSQCISSSVHIPPVYPVYRRPISQPLHLQYKHSTHYVTNKGLLTHWGWETHICVGKLTIIASDNGLAPSRCQAIIWTNAGILLIRPSETNFSEILIAIHTFSFKKMQLKMPSAKRRPFCLSLNELTLYQLDCLKYAYINLFFIPFLYTESWQV